MGCCSSKKNKNKNTSNGLEEINIESQERELINILTEVNKKIDNLKNEVIDYLDKEKSNYDDCYLI